MTPRHWAYYEKNKVQWEGWVETPKRTHKLVLPDLKVYLDGRLSGEGQDNVGEYSIEGFAGDPSRPPNHIIFQKIYDEERIIIFDGFIIDSSIRGKWRVVGTKQDGNFCLYLVSKEWNLQIEGRDMLEIFFVNASAHGMVSIGSDSFGIYLMLGVFDSFKTDMQICKQYVSSKSIAFFTGKYSSFNNRMTIRGTVVNLSKEITKFLMEGAKMKDLYALNDLDQEDMENDNDLDKLVTNAESDKEEDSTRHKSHEQQEYNHSDDDSPHDDDDSPHDDYDKNGFDKTITEHVMSTDERGNASRLGSTGIMNDSLSNNMEKAKSIYINAEKITRSPSHKRKSQEKHDREDGVIGKVRDTPSLGLRVDKSKDKLSSFNGSKRENSFIENKQMNSVSFTFSKKGSIDKNESRTYRDKNNKNPYWNEFKTEELLLNQDNLSHKTDEEMREINIKLLLTKLSNPIDESLSRRESQRNLGNSMSVHDSFQAKSQNRPSLQQNPTRETKSKQDNLHQDSKRSLDIENFTDFDLTFDASNASNDYYEIDFVDRLARMAVSEGKRMNSRQAIVFARHLRSQGGILHFFDKMAHYILSMDIKALVSLTSTLQADVRREVVGYFSHVIRSVSAHDCRVFVELFKDDMLMQRELSRILDGK